MPELGSIRLYLVWMYSTLCRYVLCQGFSIRFGQCAWITKRPLIPGNGTGRASPGKTGVNGSHLEGGSARTKKETGVESWVAVGG